MKRLLPILVLLACSCFGQIAVDQTASGAGTTGTSLACSSMTINANTLVMVWLVIDDDATTTLSVPTASGLTFAQIGSTIHSSGNYWAGWFRAYSSSALGATAITAHWNVSADAKVQCFTLTGTAGTAGSNGSDAIGNNASSTTKTTSPSVTVLSSSHDNSVYVGGLICTAGSAVTNTKGANYTNLIVSTWSTWIATTTEISTNPVTPPADTVVNGTNNDSNFGTGVFGVEILVGGGSPGTSTAPPALMMSGVGR